MSIKIKAGGGDVFEVTVAALSTTKHTVTLDDAYYQKLTDGSISKKELIQASFEFLLEREPNTSILSRFDLPLIQHYFPEYEETIQDEFL
ncbi:hypothetical protein K8I31_14600 [bacterium]|nr:hypothetical protein [bacterium]